MRTWRRVAPALPLLAAGVATGIRVTVRDRFPVLDLVYYATPWPVVAGLLVLSGGWLLLDRRPARGVLCLGLSALAVAPWGMPRASVESCQSSAETLDVVLWNVARGGQSWERVASELRATDADLIGLVEAGRRGSFDLAEGFPEHTMVDAGRGLVLLARGDISAWGLTRFGRISATAEFDVTLEGQGLRILLVDIEAYPLSRRAPLLSRVRDIAALETERTTLILGDFNTPHDSVWLEPLREQFPPAFEGYRPTWRYPIPLLMIDHVLASPELVVSCSTVQLSSLSDHARLHVSLALP